MAHDQKTISEITDILDQRYKRFYYGDPVLVQDDLFTSTSTIPAVTNYMTVHAEALAALSAKVKAIPRKDMFDFYLERNNLIQNYADKIDAVGNHLAKEIPMVAEEALADLDISHLPHDVQADLRKHTVRAPETWRAEHLFVPPEFGIEGFASEICNHIDKDGNYTGKLFDGQVVPRPEHDKNLFQDKAISIIAGENITRIVQEANNVGSTIGEQATFVLNSLNQTEHRYLLSFGQNFAAFVRLTVGLFGYGIYGPGEEVSFSQRLLWNYANYQTQPTDSLKEDLVNSGLRFLQVARTSDLQPCRDYVRNNPTLLLG